MVQRDSSLADLLDFWGGVVAFLFWLPNSSCHPGVRSGVAWPCQWPRGNAEILGHKWDAGGVRKSPAATVPAPPGAPSN